MAQQSSAHAKIPNCDAYFDTIQSKKKLPESLQQSLTTAFARIPASSFPQVPGGKVIEIPENSPIIEAIKTLSENNILPAPATSPESKSASNWTEKCLGIIDYSAIISRSSLRFHSIYFVIEIPANTPIIEAIKTLSENNILSAPVTNPDSKSTSDWREKYLGIIDYSAIILWVLENAEVAGIALTAGSVAAAGVGAGALGAIGVGVAVGATGPIAAAGLGIAALGATVAGGLAAEGDTKKDAPSAVDKVGEDFYRVLVEKEPFKSTKVESIVKSYRWAPFIPVASDSSMLSVLLLLSKYRLRNVPVIEAGKPELNNFITQSAVVQGLNQCRSNDWFVSIASRKISDFGLPFMSRDKVISVKSEELILEAFKRMKENQIGGLPVTNTENQKIVGSLSVRDIRFLLLDHALFSNFSKLTVMDFIKTINSMNPVSQLLTCTSDTCLGSVIEGLANKKVHRIYVVDDQMNVIGVVTLRDVIACFIHEPEDHFDNYLGFAMEEMIGSS